MAAVAVTFAKYVCALGARILVEKVAADSEVIIINCSRQRSISIVLPCTASPLVVCDDDQVEISMNHVDEILRAQVAHAFQITPSRVRMKISNQRKMRQVRQKFLDSL